MKKKSSVQIEEKNDGYIRIRGAEVNNLKKIDVDIPRGKFVVITGVSGSGKSSLAFDTLFAEGQRRFAESLSSFARQFLGRMSKPAVESISGIPPAIAIEQKVNTRNPRSTVATTTEIHYYLRLLFATIGRTYSPISGKEVHCDTLETVLEYLKSFPANGTHTLYLLADIRWNEEKYRVERLLNFKQEGFSRLYVQHSDTPVVKIDEVLAAPEQYATSEVSLLIDRIALADDADTLTRQMDSIRTAFEKGDGYITTIVTPPSGTPDIRKFSSVFEADGMLFEQPQEWTFNYNNPLGACPECGGYGKIFGIDESLVVPNTALSVYEDTIACWKGDVMSTFKNEVILNAHRFDFPIHTPYRQLTQPQKDVLWNGNKYITGIYPMFHDMEKQRYKIQNKYMLSRYSGKTTCPSCHGCRLRKEALYVQVGGKNIAQLMDMSISELIEFFTNLELTPYEKTVTSRAIREINQRLAYIEKVGLSYLTLSRASKTLSGGESQRINLVSSLGNSLTGSMYILDEPSIGLHQRDTQRLIDVLKNLRDLGNTVIVVEHDEEIIRAADYLIDIGPGAGVNGGEVVFAGALPAFEEAADAAYSDAASSDSGSGFDAVAADAAASASDADSDADVAAVAAAASASGSDADVAAVAASASGSDADVAAADTAAFDSESDAAAADAADTVADSLTLQYLSGRKKVFISPKKRPWSSFIEVCGACENNLKNIDVKFPLRVMTAVIGVSGSGKSTLVGDILYPAIKRHLDQFGPRPGAFRELRGDLRKISSVEYIDQNPIGKSSRSNPVTYLKVYDDIRKLFSDQPYAKLNGYGHSHFSFNIDGGRCPECQGEGTIKIPMQFMADIVMTCEACGGKRFKPDILEVRYKEKNISDILDMSVDEAISFFSAQTEPQALRIADKLRPLQSVGLNYIQLGQSSSTLSGGESQRVKLASFLGKDSDSDSSSRSSILFIFDEPTTGLHIDDISKLIRSFNALLDRGHTIVVVEHNPYIIQAADHIVELGPEGGSGGGYLL